MDNPHELALQCHREIFQVWDETGPLARMVRTLADISVKAYDHGDMTEELADLAARTYYEVHYPEGETWDKRLKRHKGTDLDILDDCNGKAVRAVIGVLFILNTQP